VTFSHQYWLFCVVIFGTLLGAAAVGFFAAFRTFNSTFYLRRAGRAFGSFDVRDLSASARSIYRQGL
jgi:hypothetical protein